MDTSSTREEPSDEIKSEVISQSLVEDCTSSLHEFPASEAHVCILTACSYSIVFIHIDIDDELLSDKRSFI
jgi:hypothetical protein